MFPESDDEDISLRRIKTARNEEAINAAAEQGFRPLIKPVVPSSQIQSKFRVVQNKVTGKINTHGDYRSGDWLDSDWEVVIDWTFFYPHSWASPFAAYLIPADLQKDEMVVLEDLIEDLVGVSWNQGDVYRLKSCRARWTGDDFVLDYNPILISRVVVG